VDSSADEGRDEAEPLPSRLDNVFGLDDPFDEWSDVPDHKLTPERLAHRTAAAAVRRLISRMASTSATADQLLALAEHLDRATDRMPAGAVPGGPGAEEGIAEAAMVVHHADRLLERSPFVGRANPVAPPLHLAVVDGHVEATVTFGRTYEGPPGYVHGGYVAGIFDEALGAAQAFSGRAGMTGRLTVHYRSPTPLDTELRLRADMDSLEGRKIHCTGTLWAGDRVCAEAEGLFITIDPAVVQAMLERRSRGVG
jgi:acyl-coenzyme A thioesterase PaaI-like protein